MCLGINSFDLDARIAQRLVKTNIVDEVERVGRRAYIWMRVVMLVKASLLEPQTTDAPESMGLENGSSCKEHFTSRETTSPLCQLAQLQELDLLQLSYMPCTPEGYDDN